jgi:hypothetical protein
MKLPAHNFMLFFDQERAGAEICVLLIRLGAHLLQQYVSYYWIVNRIGILWYVC